MNFYPTSWESSAKIAMHSTQQDMMHLHMVLFLASAGRAYLENTLFLCPVLLLLLLLLRLKLDKYPVSVKRGYGYGYCGYSHGYDCV